MTKRRKNRQDRLADIAGRTNPAVDVWRNFCKHPVSVIALIIIVALIVTAIASGFIFSYKDITAINAKARNLAPNAEHWFGTDDFGRDLFTRVLYGARYSLFIGITVSVISMLIGILIGASCAYFGGVLDVVVMRIMDAVICIPSMLLMLTLLLPSAKAWTA